LLFLERELAGGLENRMFSYVYKQLTNDIELICLEDFGHKLCSIFSATSRIIFPSCQTLTSIVAEIPFHKISRSDRDSHFKLLPLIRAGYPRPALKRGRILRRVMTPIEIGSCEKLFHFRIVRLPFIHMNVFPGPICFHLAGYHENISIRSSGHAG